MERLEGYGWSPEWAAIWESMVGDQGGALAPARVVEEQRGVCRVATAHGDLFAEVSGRLRYMASGPEDLPAVGDWVAIVPPDGDGRATVHTVLERRSALVRKAPERPAAAQVLAANVDTAFVVTSLNRDFNPRRIERMVALVREGGATPVVLLSKSDLAAGAADEICEIAERAAPGIQVARVSALTGEGMDALGVFLGVGQTVALLGSSGVGKSTLANRLAGRDELATSEVRDADDKGRHTTTHRQILALETGAVLVDTPGLREVGLWSDESGGVESAFPDVEVLLSQCRFADCGHTNEPGCAVREAVESGALAPERFDSYEKLAREAERLRLRRDAHGRHEQRKKAKRFARSLRQRPDKRRRD